SEATATFAADENTPITGLAKNILKRLRVSADNDGVPPADPSPDTTVPVGSSPEGVAITPDSAFAYVVNHGDNTVSVIDTSSNTVVGSPIGVGSGPFGFAITPNGAFAYVADTNVDTVSVIDTSSNTVSSTIPGFSFPRAVAATPDGAFIYVVNLNTN